MRLDIKGVIVTNEDGWIYDWYGFENTTPKKVKEAVKQAKDSAEPLDVYINSGGGDLSAGSEIYAELSQVRNLKIHVIEACSAASVIMCAGKSDIVPSGMVMIHNVRMGADGDHRDMEHASDVLKTADKAVAAAYCAKSGKSEKEMLELMAKETWLTALQAVEMGLVDEIAAPEGQSIPQLAASKGDLLPEKMVSAMRQKRMEAITRLELLKLRR